MAVNKRTIEGYVNDLFSDFFYYNRKEDEDFTVADAAKLSEVITKEEFIQMFLKNIDENFC